MDITLIVETLIAFICAVVSCVVIPLIKKHTNAAQQKEINAWVAIAVTAAEQIFQGNGRGDEKKAYVLDFLSEKGYTLDANSIDALIESAVYELKTGLIPEETA